MLAQFGEPDEEAERDLVGLYEDVEPDSLGDLREVMLSLVRAKLLEQLYRVHSPVGDRPGLEDYASYEAIPPSLPDETQDPAVDFEIGLGDIEVVYRLPAEK